MRKPESITLHRKNADIYSRNYSRHKAKGKRREADPKGIKAEEEI